MRVDAVVTTSEFADLASDWNRLSRGVPFRSFEWQECWWRHYGLVPDRSLGDRELRILVVRDGDQVVGIAPWYCEKTFAGGSVLKFLGSGEIYSDYLTLLADDGAEAQVAAAIGRYLAQEESGRWDALEVAGVDGEDYTTICLLIDLESRGIPIRRRPDFHCWRIELPDSFDAYLARLSKSHRKQIRRVERRLAQTGTVRFWRANEPEEIDLAYHLLVGLHQERQRGQGRAGAFASTRFGGFHAEVIRRLARTGQLRLDVLQLGGVPISAEYQIIGNDVVYAYQSGIDPHYLSLEPGRAALAMAVRSAIEDRFRAFDLLRGDEPYKAHFRAKPRPTLRARAVASHRGARWRHALWLAQDHTRQWMKQAFAARTPSTI